MPDLVEVAVERALLDRYNAFQYNSPDTLFRAQPYVTFSPPTPGLDVYWLRATYLPADSLALSVDFGGSDQHYGLFAIDVFYGQGSQGSGEVKPARIAAAVIAWFDRGTVMTRDGFTVRVIGKPYRSRAMNDGPWVMIPVSVPYVSYAT